MKGQAVQQAPLKSETQRMLALITKCVPGIMGDTPVTLLLLSRKPYSAWLAHHRHKTPVARPRSPILNRRGASLPEKKKENGQDMAMPLGASLRALLGGPFNSTSGLIWRRGRCVLAACQCTAFFKPSAVASQGLLPRLVLLRRSPEGWGNQLRAGPGFEMRFPMSFPAL